MSRKHFPLLFALLSVVALAGCVTQPPATLVQPWPKTPPDGYATLFYYGDGGNASFYVDDTRAFKMWNNCYTWVYVRAGQHTVSTKWNFMMAGLDATGHFTALPGKAYYLKSLMGTGGVAPYYVTVGNAMIQVPEAVARDQAPRRWYHLPLVQQIDTVITNTPAALDGTGSPAKGMRNFGNTATF